MWEGKEQGRQGGRGRPQEADPLGFSQPQGAPPSRAPAAVFVDLTLAGQEPGGATLLGLDVGLTRSLGRWPGRVCHVVAMSTSSPDSAAWQLCELRRGPGRPLP